MKRYHLWVSVTVVVLFGFLIGRDALAIIAWHRYGRVGIAIALNRRNAELAMQIGNYYFNGGAYDLEEAEQAYRKAIEINPSTPLAHYQLGRIRFLRGDFGEAIRYINAELELHPEIPNSFYVRGLINGYAARYPEAARDFEKFIELVPEQWAGYNDLAWILAKQGKFREAEAAVVRAFERLPEERRRNVWLWTSLGVARMNLGEYDRAKESLDTARSIAEDMTPEYFWSAYPGNNQKEAPRAFGEFLAALHFNLGLVNEHLGLIEEAKKEYQAYLALLPPNASLERSPVEDRITKLQNASEAR